MEIRIKFGKSNKNKTDMLDKDTLKQVSELIALYYFNKKDEIEYMNKIKNLERKMESNK